MLVVTALHCLFATTAMRKMTVTVVGSSNLFLFFVSPFPSAGE
jgi:hypothetical protein